MLDDDAMARLREAFAQVPFLADAPPARAEVTRLAGLTNLVYRVDRGGESYVLRLAGPGTEDYIDRAVEGHNARIAAAADVSPEVLHFDAESGLMVTRFLAGTTTMTPELFASRAGAPRRAAEAFKRLHSRAAPFRFRFELFAMIDDYRGVLAKRQAELPPGYEAAVEEAQEVRAALDAHPAELAPCHCDPLCENFLDEGERMWIVDWEYSGMNDPLWDLGDLSVEAAFDAAQDEEMMVAYCGGAVSEAAFGRMVIYKAMCDLLWTLWGLIQHADENPAEDFWAYSINRFERCRELMGRDDFARHAAAVARG